MSRLLATLTIIGLLCGATAAQEKEIYFTLPDRTKLTFHEAAVRDALLKEPAEAPLNESLQKSIEFVAQFHVLKLAEATTAQKLRDEPKAMSAQVEISESFIQKVFPIPERKDTVKNPPVQMAFLKAMLKELDRVLQNPQQYPIVRINEARILSRLAASSGEEEVIDLLVKVLADTQQIDGVRYYACQGLDALLKRLPKGVKDPKRRGELVAALVTFIERKPPLTPNTTAEVEGLRMLRREGIRALSGVREAIIPGVANGHAALCLSRVVARDAALVPEPRLDEQVEATIGLARMAPDDAKEFQPAQSAYFIGRFVAQFGTAYKDKDSKPGREPWRVHAARMDDALKEMASRFDEATVKSVQQLCAPILSSIVNTTPVNTDPVKNWIDANPPAQKTVYKSDPKSLLNPRAVKSSE